MTKFVSGTNSNSSNFTWNKYKIFTTSGTGFKIIITFFDFAIIIIIKELYLSLRGRKK